GVGMGVGGVLTDFSGYDLKPEVLRRVPRALALRYDILSLAADGNLLTVALADPASEDIVDRLRLATGMQVRTVQATREFIREQLEGIYPSNAAPARKALNHSDEAPAIRTLDCIHERAALAHASDLHVEPTRSGGRVRQRIDGILHEIQVLDATLFAPVASRIKLLAGMDIADKRQPQDGRYTIEAHGRSIDARVSSMPTIAGEKLVVRLLNHQTQIPSLEHLGMPPGYLETYRRIIHAPHGFVVVCGPTGSGKTTTLYASLAERNLDTQNLCSVEDPVEIRIGGVAQVQVNARAGLTFASVLRSFLRQDPNVIMVGEMRDAETADVAVSAALSGQLVMTTLHSNDAVRTLDRLLELGVERHSIASAMTGIVAQRLVRVLCRHCRVQSVVSQAEAQDFGIEPDRVVYVPRGCKRCDGTGYRGRTGIFEFLFIDDRVRDAIASGSSTVTIGTLAREAGYSHMSGDGLGKAFSGNTSLDELRRVLSFEQSL
ncbi:MAG: type II/IV secretion system protein, partial [Candidatus Eremiobacteraeota bacterium]|nr:type II/IV secretion system protein [Candidatus Eremiobacteraeota bacterium]